MKLHAYELPCNSKKKPPTPWGFKKVILLILTSSLLTIILLSLRSTPNLFSSQSSSSSSSLLQSPPMAPSPGSFSNATLDRIRNCNIFKGDWIRFAGGPYYYANSSRCAIDDRQNCLMFGRSDTEFVRWRWKPDRCELPRFDAERFLELVRGKTMAFVGDSVGRNQVESLMCLLARVAHPDDAPSEEGAVKRWLYRDHNFTLATIWSPNLVKCSDGNRIAGGSSAVVGLLSLCLDKPDEAWVARIENFDYVIISAGHWFSRPLIYQEKGRVVGCHECRNYNITELSRYYGYRMALRTTFGTILAHRNFKGVTILRTISPTHFGSEDWVSGGNCSMTRPFSKQEAKIDAHNLEMYLTEVDEFRAAEREGRRRGLEFRLLDVTAAMAMRADGHPYRYGKKKKDQSSIADCLHWCLPGPIDSWNEFLVHLLEMDLEGSG